MKDIQLRKNEADNRSAFQNPHKADEGQGRYLEEAIGREVRRYREKANLTIADLARSADLSAGMLSKIENGATSASLGTLQALSKALQVPFTALFKSYEEIRDATFVKAGQGLTIERRGTRAGHQYQLLGHTTHGPVMVEPYLITLRHESDVFPTFQHAGMEFLYMLEGNVLYRHGEKTYDMHPGDALFFDAEAPHGPEEMRKLPARYLSIISYRRDE
ncbi:helix-turn-helix domain-containing protein [Aestuariivirga litoralis]|nr:helix-turn-helix domain-containing protein [Aestuariivirga litoralis]